MNLFFLVMTIVGACNTAMPVRVPYAALAIPAKATGALGRNDLKNRCN